MSTLMPALDQFEPELRVHREIGPGVHWLCGCIGMAHKEGVIHSYAAPYLVLGTESAILVDTGHPTHWLAVEAKLRSVLGDRPLDYVFPTHPELPHSGNIARLLATWPDSRLVGDIRDLHLYYPDLTGRMVAKRPGDTIDLGDRVFYFQEALIRDLPNTLWGFEDRAGALFVGDGFGFAHFHGNEHCGRIAEETPDELTPQQVAFLNDAALGWTRYVDIEPILDDVHRLIEELGVRIIGPAHGAAMTKLSTFEDWMKKIIEARDLRPAARAAVIPSS